MSSAKKESTPKDSSAQKKVLFIVLAVVLVAIIVVGTVIALVLNKKKEAPDQTHEVAWIDADEFYGSQAEIISRVKATSSETVHTEAEVCENFSSRGFSGCSITAEYSIDGEYLKEIEVSALKATKHPAYDCYYTTNSGDVWFLSEINGSLFAIPLSYQFEKESGGPIYFSETGTITGYDCVTNTFYEIVPYESTAIVKRVERINAETLESFSYEAIDAL